jgi:hypothetical protein
MNPSAWVGLAFCGTSENVHFEGIDPCIRMAAVQICWGQRHPNIDPNLDHAKRVIADCHKFGLTPAGWGWCDGPNVEAAQAEGRYHAQTALDLGLAHFVANCEEPYDAHGDASSGRYRMANEYAQTFRSVASESQIELGLTTTPRWASDGTGMRNAGAVIMPQCFTGEVPSATISAAVPFMESWGWTVDRIRPLVQTYQTQGQWPNMDEYNTQAWACSVGVVPYTLEQGGAVIPTLAPSIAREPVPQPTPIPPPDTNGDKPDEGGETPPPPELPFARALYPPDATDRGKQPSTPGADVEAVKRAVSRAGGGGGSEDGFLADPPKGFWKWQSFDRNYSNAFAHGGTSGSGMEGFQRALVAAEPTGWYGSKTHEALRTYRIPQGLQNAGQYAFDSRACELYRSASV